MVSKLLVLTTLSVLSLIVNSYKLYGFGYYELGTGDNRERILPTKIKFFENETIIDVTTGYGHSIFVNSEFKVFIVGDNRFGQLGIGNKNSKDSIEKNLNLKDLYIKSVSTGMGHSLVLTKNGKVYSFGHNGSGELGIGTSTEQLYPTEILHFKNITSIAAGRSHSMFLMNGSVYSFGGTDSGSTGLGCVSCIFKTPTKITSLSSEVIIQISTSFEHSLFLSIDGLIFSTGKNSNGELGLGDFVMSSVPKFVNISKKVTKISTGYAHSIFISEGDTYSFGSNTYGQLGLKNRSFQPVNIPTKIEMNERFESMILAFDYSILFTKTKIYSFGDNKYGQLGLGNDEFTSIPTEIPFHYLNLTTFPTPNFHFARSIFYQQIHHHDCFGVDSNDNIVCNARGICSKQDFCICDSEISSGVNCEFPKCFGTNFSDPNVCSGQGKCVNSNKCECKPGFGGLKCDSFTCFNKTSTEKEVCSGNGICVCSGNGYCSLPNNCNCNLKYSGKICEFPFCFNKSSNDSAVCSSRGYCKSPDKCICKEGYFGENCGLTKCFGKLSNDSFVCSSFGKCKSPDNCVCNKGYNGNRCEYPNCFDMYNTSLICGGQGFCQSPNNCSCNYGYSGLNCNFASCIGKNQTDPNVCSSYGFCISIDNCYCKFYRFGRIQ
eukprot:gene4915-8503_t